MLNVPLKYSSNVVYQIAPSQYDYNNRIQNNYIHDTTTRLVVIMWFMTSPKSVRLKDRDYDVTPNIIAHMYPQIRNGSVKECEVEMVGEECEVYCEDGRRRVLVLTGHAGRVAPISPMLKRRISCGLEILN